MSNISSTLGLCEYSRDDMIEIITTNALNKLNYEFEMCMIDHNINLLNIENKLINENGTEDDALYLYTAEAEEVNNKSKGILSKMIDVVLKFFRSIKEFFFGKKDKVDDIPDEVQVPENPDELMAQVNKFTADANEFLSGKNKKKKFVVGGSVAGGVISGFIFKKIWSKLQKGRDELDNLIVKAKSDLSSGKIPLEDEPKAKSMLNVAKKYGSRILNCAKSALPGGNKAITNASEFIVEVASINKNLNTLMQKVKNVVKKNYDKLGNKFTKNRAYNRIKELEKIGLNKRTSKEELEYQKLLNKYGSFSVSKDTDTKKCDAFVDTINKAIESNNNKIKEARSNANFDKKAVTSNIKSIRSQYNKIAKYASSNFNVDIK